MDGGEPGISYTYLLQHRVSQKVVSRIMSQKNVNRIMGQCL